MSNTAADSNKSNLFILNLKINDVTPEIWRRLAVPSDIPLEAFHDIVQVCMDWNSYESFSFKIADKTIDPQQNDKPIESFNIKVGDSFSYTCGSEENWTFNIVVEELREARLFEAEIGCRGGERQSPPDAVSGPQKYKELLADLAAGNDGKKEEILKFLEVEEFNSDEFNLGQVNELIQIELLIEEEEAEHLLDLIEFEDSVTLGMKDELSPQEEESLEELFIYRTKMALTSLFMAEDPKEVRETLERLVSSGMDEAEAFSMILVSYCQALSSANELENELPFLDYNKSEFLKTLSGLPETCPELLSH